MALDLDHVKQWIRLNINKAKDISSVADALELSSETLRKSFHRMERVSLSDFLRHEKIEAVKSRLITTDDKCFEIIFDLRLGREDSFARLFKSETGMTMQGYREAARAGNCTILLHESGNHRDEDTSIANL